MAKSLNSTFRSNKFDHYNNNVIIDRNVDKERISGTMIRRRFRPRVPFVSIALCSILLCYSPVLISAAVVTLDSIEVFSTHEWLPSEPTFYFQCKGENKIALPDVKEERVSYSFKGLESWQPLTELPDIKCKRCGFYEKDAIKADHVFDEWELCPSDFNRSDGRYIHFKEKELNATFICTDCVSLGNASAPPSPKPKTSFNWMHWILIVGVSVLVSVLFIIGLVAACKFWQKRKRQRDQARFLKLFEEGDEDIEDELGIGPLSHSI